MGTSTDAPAFVSVTRIDASVRSPAAARMRSVTFVPAGTAPPGDRYRSERLSWYRSASLIVPSCASGERSGGSATAARDGLGAAADGVAVAADGLGVGPGEHAATASARAARTVAADACTPRR